MAIPILAAFIAGASLTPSPVTATNSPLILLYYIITKYY